MKNLTTVWPSSLSILVLCLLVSTTSSGAPSPLQLNEQWVVTLGDDIPERMYVAKGRINKQNTWFIEYVVGNRLYGRKLISPAHYKNFRQELTGHLKLSRTKSLGGHATCHFPVLVHHQKGRKGKIKKSEICPQLLGTNAQLKFGQWFQRWKELVVRGRFF